MNNFTTRLWRKAFFLQFLVGFLLVGSGVLHAQESTVPTGSFAVRPAKVELIAEPGEQITRNIEIANGTGLPLSIVVSYEDIAPKTQAVATEDAVSLLGEERGEYPLSELMSTTKKSFRLVSGEAMSVPVTVTIPKDAPPGGLYGSVVFTFKPIFSKDSTESQNIAIESRLASLFFVRVAGETREEGEIAAFGLFNQEKYLKQPSRDKPLRFQVAYTNAGNVHLNPYGRMVVSSTFGNDVEVVIDPWVVLPGATRMRELNVHNALSPGFYTAKLEQNRGYQDIVDERVVSFWILPNTTQWAIMLIVLLATTLLVRRSLKLSKHFVSTSST